MNWNHPARWDFPCRYSRNYRLTDLWDSCSFPTSTFLCQQDEPSTDTINLSFTSGEMNLKFKAGFDDDGNLETSFESSLADGRVAIQTKRKFEISSKDYKQQMAGWLEQYAYDLHHDVSIEMASRIVQVIQDLIEKIWAEQGAGVFRDERYGGLHYLKAVFGSISRSESRTASNFSVPPVGDITPYEGYLASLTPFYAQEEIRIYLVPFRNWLDTGPDRLLVQDIEAIKSEIPSTGWMTYKTYFAIPWGNLLEGGDCGCCGNYEGVCWYASYWCYLHDFLCQECQYVACFSGCEETPCNPF